ncbi:MAG: spore maturation protein [Clostridia bacterium]|nr:spore maturation protein [Clostridia bacterium]
MAEFISAISSWAIPAIILVILIYGIVKDVKVYEAFIEGAKEGIMTAVKVIPYLMAMIIAITMFKESGAMNLLIFALTPIAKLIGIPSEVLPLAVMRPLSGSASLGMVADIIKNYGADSSVGRIASTMMGSTETIFYTLAVYFGAVGIRNSRYTLKAALIADIVGVIASVWICTLVFG